MSEKPQLRQRNLLLCIALLAPSVAWGVQLSASYMIAAYACATDRMWILHTIGGVALLAGGIGLGCAWKARSFRREYGGDTDSEARFLVGFTLLLSSLVVLAILAGELSNWLLPPCV